MTGPLGEARAHLDKAREFRDAAVLNLEHGLWSAATSAAVSSGINAKDAVCLKLTGQTRKTQRHEDAVTELRKAGRGGAELAPVLARLLKLKDRAQYGPRAIARNDAAKAVAWAANLYEGAKVVVTEP